MKSFKICFAFLLNLLVFQFVFSQPEINLHPVFRSGHTLDFGNTQDGGERFNLTNVGNETLQLTKIAVEGPDANVFIITNRPSTPRNVAAHSELDFDVFFRVNDFYSSISTKSAILRVLSNDADESDLHFHLIAHAEPNIWVPTPFDLGSVNVGSSYNKGSAYHWISNYGSLNLAITGFTIIGTNAADFKMKDYDGSHVDLLPGESFHFNPEFRPLSAGRKSATIVFSSNDPDNQYNSMDLYGTGISTNAPDIASNPSYGFWGSVSIGSSSGKTFVISNEGNDNLSVSGTYLDGTNKSEFNIQSGGGAFTLSPGSTRDIRVRLAPSASGTKNAMLKLTSNDPDEATFFIYLSGSGGGSDFTINIDGNKDSFYNNLTGPSNGYLQIRSYAWNDNGSPDNDNDLSAKVWTAWDDRWLYIYEEVKDNTLSGNSFTPWENDCFELKVDPQATSEENSVWETRLTALGMETAGVVTEDTLNSIWESGKKKWARKTISGGYALEMAIEWSAIHDWENTESITPAVNNKFGAAICQQENDGGGMRDATLMWAAVMSDAAWSTPAYLGTVTFLSDHKLKFEAKNTIKGTTNPIPYDGSDYTRSDGFAITVDGNKDTFYAALTGPDDGYLQLRSYAYNDNGRPDNDTDLSSKIWTAWDSEWLYIYEEVKDNTLSGNSPNVWEEDCFEMCIDPQVSSETNSVWQGRLTALSTSTSGVVQQDNLDNVSGSDKQVTRKTITGGYALEMAVKWSAITYGSETINPVAGNEFGAALNQHDNDGSAKRDATVQWAAVLLDAAWNTPKYLGTVKFLSNHKLQFDAVNNITGTTNPVPYNGSNYNPSTGVDEEEVSVKPKEFGLEQNVPNPFNPSTKILFSTAKPGDVRLEIFDLLGRKIRTFGNIQVTPGSHTIEWDGLDGSGQSVTSGVYLIVLSDGSEVKSKKMIMIK